MTATNFCTRHGDGRYSVFSRGGIFGGDKPTTQKPMHQKLTIPDEVRALLGCTKSPAQREAIKNFLAAKRSENVIALGKSMKAQSQRAYGKTTN